MNAGIQIAIRGHCPKDQDVQQFQEAMNFVASTVERVMEKYDLDAASFDPRTGEPFHPLNLQTDILTRIHAIGVACPSAQLAVLNGEAPQEELEFTWLPTCYEDNEVSDESVL